MQPRVTSPYINGAMGSVSILIRPEGRMQLEICQRLYLQRVHLSFQSSSGQKAGCNCRHPNRRSSLAPSHVSILIRPEGRMQHSRVHGIEGHMLVSILIRPEGRMQRGGRSWTSE